MPRSRTSSSLDGDNRQKRNLFDTFEVRPTKSNYGNPATTRFNPDFTRLNSQQLNISSHSNVMHNPTDDSHNSLIDQSPNSEANKFGTFDGVLGRCLLCMFGVILFLRMGWIVGHAGIFESSLVVLLSASITMLTTLSLCALVTNGDISHGGPYFLVSRTLGAEWGGVVGVLFAFGNAIGVALHLCGFAESIVALYSNYMLGSQHWDIVMIAELSLFFLLSVAWNGVGWIIKMNLILLFLMVISILIFVIGTFTTNSDPESLGFTGYSSTTFSDNWGSAYLEGYDFLFMLALFFPSVTGMMAGANISGDLKNPSRNIPVGTLGAVFISTATYIIIVWMLGATCLRSSEDGEGGLYNDYLIMSNISLFRPLVDMGIFASTFSSGTSCFVAAPRIFKAVCDDGLLPIMEWAGKGRDGDGEPIRAYLLVSVLVFCFQLSGDIDFIAPLVTNFFMMTYAMINYCVFAWCQSRSPGWRPSFKYYHRYLSLFACFQCILLMLLISWIIAIGTAVAAFLLYRYIQSVKLQKYWGTTTDAINMNTACKMALLTQRYRPHAKVERLTFLILNTAKEETVQLIQFARDLNYSRGLIMVGHVLIGDIADAECANKFIEYKAALRNSRGFNLNDTDFADEVLPSQLFDECVLEMCVAETIEKGSKYLFQLCGIGGIRPNVVLIKMSDRTTAGKVPLWFENVKSALSIGCGTILVPQHVNPITIQPDWEDHGCYPYGGLSDGGGGGQDIKTIDIWWLYDDGGLTLLVPYLLTLSKQWKDCKLRVMALDALNVEEQLNFAHLMTKFRIQCEILSIPKDSTESTIEISNDIGKGANRNMDRSQASSSNKESKESLSREEPHIVIVECDGEEYEMSEFAQSKIRKYKAVGNLIKRYSQSAYLCVITLPFPRVDYEWWEYKEIVAALLPKENEEKTIFVRGNQEQMLCYTL